MYAKFFGFAILLLGVAKQSWGIMGGEPASVGDFPYSVAITWKNYVFCGGILINPLHVLSTHLCVAELYDVEIIVKAGSVSLNDTKIQERSVEKRTTYPLYDHETMENNLIILELNRPFDLNDNLKLANYGCNTGKKIVAGTRYLAIGYGPTEFNQVKPNLNLNMIEVQMVSTANCKDIYYKYSQSQPEYSIFNTELCVATKYLVGPSVRDFGGPLIRRDNRDVVIGVASWTFGGYASGLPVVYIKIDDYCEFIEYTISM